MSEDEEELEKTQSVEDILKRREENEKVNFDVVEMTIGRNPQLQKSIKKHKVKEMMLHNLSLV
jgi:hypothetical protein